MSLEDLPEEIKKEILHERENKHVDNEIWVSELIHCIRKSWYRRKFPKPIDLETAWHFFRGHVFHKVFQDILNKNPDYHLEQRVVYKVNDEFSIVGKIDAIYKDGVIFDWKWQSDYFARRVKKEGALNQHQDQVLLYAFMLKNEWKMSEWPKPVIVYLYSIGADLIEVPILPDEIETAIALLLGKAGMLHAHLVNNTVPDPDNESWECRYCEYKTECENAKNM